MWVPRSVEELETAVKAGELLESDTLDFKREPTKKSKDLAKKIAALANYGWGDNIRYRRRRAPQTG